MDKRRKYWTAEEISLLKEIFPHNHTNKVCEKIGKSYYAVANMANILGLKKDPEFKAAMLERLGRQLENKGTQYRFKKGVPPHNAGKKTPEHILEKCRHTFFKKGNIPPNAKKEWTEVYRTDKLGKKYTMIKLPNERRLRYKHIWLWEQHNGKVPEGYNVVFKDKNPLNCTIENLECISKAELMKRNTMQRFPKELQTVMRLVKKIKRITNEKQN
jgi:hypothetical protein